MIDHLPFFDPTKTLAENFPSEFRISPSEFGEIVENSPKIGNLTEESENLKGISSPDSPSV